MRITAGMLRGHTNRVNLSGYSFRTRRNNTAKKTASSLATTKINKNTAYTGLSSKARSLQTSAATLASTNKNNVFTNARTTGSKKELLNQAKSMVNGFNDTLKATGSSGVSINRAYRQMLMNTASVNSNALAGIGIYVGKDKSLSIDEENFQNASIDEIEKVLGQDAGFSGSLSQIAGNIAQSDIASEINTLGGYGAYGSTNNIGNNYLASLFSSRFNFWQ